MLPTVFSDRELTRVLDDEMDLFQSTAVDEGINLQCLYSFSAWYRMEHEHYADLLRLHQVLTNLLSNALKFTKVGSVQLELIDTDDGWFTISCRDTGVGISVGDLSLLFERFAQLEEGRQLAGGSGLGLHISRSICQSLGGSLQVGSVVGAGTAFTVRFPWGGAFGGVSHIQHRRSKCQGAVIAVSLGVCVGVIVGDFLMEELINRYIAPQFSSVKFRRFISLDDLASETQANGPMDRLIIDIDCVSLTRLKVVSSIFENSLTILLVNSETKTHGISQAVVITPKPLHPSYLYQLFSVEPADYTFGFHASPTPLPPTTSSSSGGRVSAQEMIESDVKRVRVLVVDDVAINRKVAERLLIRIYGEDKVDITTSNDGKDAVDVFSSRNGEFDVILMDLMMPILDGFGALEQIRRMDSDIPVIALTAGAGDLLDRADQQFSQVLTKPFTFGGLVEALSSVSVYDAEDVSMQPFLKASYD